MRRIFWLMLFLIGLGYVVQTGFRSQRLETDTRSMLLAVQTAIQDYHVDQERYIPRKSLTGTEVLSVLSDFDFLPSLPINPWSGQPWKLDGVEPDFLRYESDGTFEIYALRALDPDTGEVVMEIDSESNPSLE